MWILRTGVLWEGWSKDRMYLDAAIGFGRGDGEELIDLTINWKLASFYFGCIRTLKHFKNLGM